MTLERAEVIADTIAILARIEAVIQTMEIDQRLHPSDRTLVTIETAKIQRTAAKKALVIALMGA